MYIIDRLTALLGKSDPDSSDYILASCFLDRSSFMNEKVTLAEIEQKTFISKSSINRFVRACGASTLKSFCASLRKEYEEDALTLKQIREEPAAVMEISRKNQTAVKNAAEAARNAQRVFFYGSAVEISMFPVFIHTCLHHGIQPVILNDWPISQIRKKLAAADENDVLFFVETGYSLQMMEIRMALYEEVIQYSELSAFAGTKVFIGGASAQTAEFSTVEVTSNADSLTFLLQIDKLLAERM